MQGDDFDASRLLTRRARQLDVRGAPVAVAANRNALFITGDADEENLEALAVVAEKELRSPRSLAPLLLRYGDEGWETWLAPPGSKLRPRFRGGRMEKLDAYPERWRVEPEGFPTDAELQSFAAKTNGPAGLQKQQ